jgi:ankyrin repeat protein
MVLWHVLDSNTSQQTTDALQHMSMYGHTSVAQLCIEKGADVRGETKYGWTPLLYKARAGNKDMMELLVSKGADVNARDDDGMTTLHYTTSWRYDRDIAEFLIAKGADVNSRDNQGWPALQLAKKAGKKISSNFFESTCLNNNWDGTERIVQTDALPAFLNLRNRQRTTGPLT